MTEQTKSISAADRLRAYEAIQPRTAVSHNDVVMNFSTPSVLTYWRAKSIFEKEPCTLDWIASFDPEDKFLDCGANVGMYSIWAAATRGVSVYAFEPEAQNYAILNRNILLNKLSGRVSAFCVGLSDEAALSQLHISDLRVGGSCHAVGEELDFSLKQKKSSFVQGCVVMKLDEIVTSGVVPVPTHIKIDVDGFEHKVIAGARNTLRNDRLKSLLIEVNQNLHEHMGIVEELKLYGFGFNQAQVSAAERKNGVFKGVAEYIFRR